MTKIAITLLLGTSCAASACGCAYLGNKVRKLTKKIGMAFRKFENSTEQDISDEMVKTCVQHAADREIARYAKAASAEVVTDIRREVKDQVTKAMQEAMESLEKDVADEIARQAADIGPKALQKKVTEQAEKRILDKFDKALDRKMDDFDDKLDGKMDQFTDKLNGLIGEVSGNIGLIKKIHDQISDALNDNGRELKLRVG